MHQCDESGGSGGSSEAPRLEFAFSCVAMMGHFMPLLPYMRGLLDRGHSVTLFCHNDESDPKSGANGQQWGAAVKRLEEYGLQDVFVVPLKLPEGVMAGQPLFDAIVSYYSSHQLPAAIIVEFFATAASDAGDFLGIPVVNIFPNPLGGTLLPAPGPLRTWRWWLHSIGCAVSEAMAARMATKWRNMERNARTLAPLTEQDMWPSAEMTRFTICLSGKGLEYDFPHSPLLHFVGPSPPVSFPALRFDKHPVLRLGAWINEQQKQNRPVIYVAFGTMYSFTEQTCREFLVQLEELIGLGASVLWSLPAVQQKLLLSSTSQAYVSANAALRIESFVPQYAVLQHPHVKVFVTHCGANSVYEGVMNEVPMVCCPTGADQFANAARVKSAGAGVVAQSNATSLGWYFGSDPTGGLKIVEAAVEVLDNLVEFADRVGEAHQKLSSQGGSERAVDLIESVGRNDYPDLAPRKVRRSWTRVAGTGVLSGCTLLALSYCCSAYSRRRP